MEVGDHASRMLCRRSLASSLVCGVSLAALIALPTVARADNAGEGSSPLPIEIHAFVSQGFIKSTSNNYLAEHSTKGSFEFTEVGINFSKQLTDRMRAGMQLFTHDLGP